MEVYLELTGALKTKQNKNLRQAARSESNTQHMFTGLQSSAMLALAGLWYEMEQMPSKTFYHPLCLSKQ